MSDDLPDRPLSAATRKALDAARAYAERPTDEQRLRMKAALLAKLGATAATAAGTSAKVAATAKTSAAVTSLKVVVGLALVGGAVATVLAVGRPSAHVTLPREAQPAVSATPSLVASASASAAATAARAPLPAPPPSAPSAALAPSAHADDDEAFRREVDAVRQAQLHMAEDEPAQALAVLKPWTSSTTDPLRDERWAIEIEALCQTGQTSEGLRQRAAFLRALPSSPLAARVRRACPSADADPGF